MIHQAMINSCEEFRVSQRYLEVTFRKGKPFAAYFYLPRNPGEKSVGTEKAGAGILIDYGKSGHPIGIEITDPNKINWRVINEILIKLNLHPAEEKNWRRCWQHELR